LNGGTAKGGIFAFKLDTLSKLKNTKANGDSAFTLLHYIIDNVVNNEGGESFNQQLLSFFADLKQAGSQESTFIQGEISKLQSNVRKLEKELKTVEKEEKENPELAKNDRFIKVMSEFNEFSQKKAEALNKRWKVIEEQAQKLA
jgi:hypothetical protein